MKPKITNLAHAREARAILRRPGLRPSLYALARHVLGLDHANPYAGWAK
jgi:glutamate synthase domain-containing protein 1